MNTLSLSASISAQIRRLRSGRVFSVTGKLGTDWWIRVPRGYRWITDWHGEPLAAADQTFYSLTDDDWPREATTRTFSEDESARIVAVLALSGRLPEEYA